MTCMEPRVFESATAEAVENALSHNLKGDLSAICTWPDLIRHSIHTPDKACTWDCHDPHGLNNMCVAGAVQNFTQQLLHYRKGTLDLCYNTTEVLLFLSHFMEICISECMWHLQVMKEGTP